MTSIISIIRLYILNFLLQKSLCLAYRDLFFDIKRPVVVVESEYEIKEIQKQAPDWFRFRRSRAYEPKEERPGEERAIMRLAEPAEPKPVFIKLAKEFLRKRKQNLLS